MIGRLLPPMAMVAIILGAFGVALGEDGNIGGIALDRQWESLMLQGKSIVLIDGNRLRESGVPYQTYKGEVDQVWISDRGIRLDDLSERSFGGLFTKGGWRLQGGLLFAIAYQSGGLIELYGKSRWRVDPAFLHFGKSPPRSARHSYEFFLIYRPRDGETAKTLAKWMVPPENVPYDHYLVANLTYSEGTDVVTVTVADVDSKSTYLKENVAVSERILH